MFLVFARWLERWFGYAAVSLIMGAYTFLPLRFAQGGDAGAAQTDPGTQNIYNTVSMGLIFAGLVVLFCLRWQRIVLVIRASPAVNAFALLALASVVWSLDPEVTLRRVFTLITAVAFGYYLASRYAPVEALRLVAGATVFSGIASAVLAIAVPSVGRMAGTDNPALAGDWEGVFTHKNTLGTTMVVACLLTGWLLVHEKRRRATRIVSLLICLGVAAMTASRTAQMALLLLLPLSAVVRSVRLPGLPRLWVFYGLLVGALLGGFIASEFFADILYALGKDPSLTGRLPLWQLLSDEIAQRPLLGYGYGAFFIADNRELDYLNKVLGWVVPEAHQGYIELAIQLGYIGLGISIWVALTILLRALAAMRDRATPWASVAAVYVLVVLIINTVEATLMRSSTLESILLPYFAAALCLESAQRKATRKAVGFPR